MVRTYRLGGAERERARALIRILSIDMDRVRWLDGHPMTVRVFDDGKCWVEYTGLVVCDKEDIDFCLRGLEPVDVSRFRGLDHRDDDGAGLMALELGGSTVFDDSAASRRHPNVSFGEPPVVAQYPPVPIRLIHSPIGREVQASFRVEGQQQRRQSHPVVRQPFPHGSDSSHKKMPPIGAAANARLKEGPK